MAGNFKLFLSGSSAVFNNLIATNGWSRSWTLHSVKLNLRVRRNGDVRRSIDAALVEPRHSDGMEVVGSTPAYAFQCDRIAQPFPDVDG